MKILTLSRFIYCDSIGGYFSAFSKVEFEDVRKLAAELSGHILPQVNNMFSFSPYSLFNLSFLALAALCFQPALAQVSVFSLLLALCISANEEPLYYCAWDPSIIC